MLRHPGVRQTPEAPEGLEGRGAAQPESAPSTAQAADVSHDENRRQLRLVRPFMPMNGKGCFIIEIKLTYFTLSMRPCLRIWLGRPRSSDCQTMNGCLVG